MPDPNTTKELPFYQTAVFWITILLLIPVYWVVYKVMDAADAPSNHDIRLMVVTAVISGVLGSVYGYWLASSYSSGKKDDTIAAALPKVPDPSAPGTQSSITQSLNSTTTTTKE